MNLPELHFAQPDGTARLRAQKKTAGWTSGGGDDDTPVPLLSDPSDHMPATGIAVD